MGRASGTSVTCYVHGDKSPYADAHHSPNIYLKFTATTSRNGMAVSVKLSSMTFKALGGYGYPMTVYASINGGAWNKLDKSTAITAVTWTRHPSAKTLSISSFSGTEIPIAIGATSSDAKQCYHKKIQKIATYKFNVPAANYTLTYDANGGSNAPAPVTVSPNTVVSITEEEPFANLTVNYYMNPPSTNLWYPESKKRDFINWNTKADGSGTYYKANDPDPAHNSITMTSNVTLYAQWDSVSYTIKPYRDPLGIDIIFRPQGGTVVPTINHVSFPQSGYNTSVDETGTTYMPGQTYKFNIMTLDLYPKYSDNHATVQDVDLPPTLPDSSITRTGYSFEGWYLDEQYNTKIPDLYYTDQNPLYLYAKWKPLPVYKKTETGWVQEDDSFVWQCVEVTEGGVTTKVWKKIAHVLKCVEDSSGDKSWKDMSR